MERSRHFETQHRLLLLETLYDAGLSLGAMPDEDALAEDVLGRVVGVLDASRGYLATFVDGGARRAEARVGFPKRPLEAVVAGDEFLREVLGAEGAVVRERGKLLGRPVNSAVGVRIMGAGRPIGVLALADKEVRRGGGSAAFDEEDRRFLVSLAGLCGMAIENRRHLERLTRERERLEEENRRLLDETGRAAAGRLFVGESPAARRVLDLVSRVAPSKISVLITGESGTGKEVVARAVHHFSEVAQRIFLPVNCAAIPENLLESQLFGHVRGAFTGAVTAQEGLFTRARGGTIFLDEIGDMPFGLQSKLLRAIETKEVQPVGSTQTIAVDVRIIAASNHDLRQMVDDGKFRDDLYYRLNVVHIPLPPLRDRREDIPRLVEYLVRRHNREMKRAYRGVDSATLKLLVSQPWKGNVRELDNVIEHAMILGNGEWITVADLPRPLRENDDVLPAVGDELREALRAYERIHIETVLRRAGRDKRKAAELLGLSLSSLYRKMNELGIDLG